MQEIKVHSSHSWGTGKCGDVVFTFFTMKTGMRMFFVWLIEDAGLKKGLQEGISVS